MNRAYSTLTIRTIEEDQRLIEGIASSPRPDRIGDIVDPLGVTFKLPLPLLLDHDHTLAVGDVVWAKATATGIQFRAQIAKIAEPGAAKDLVDRAWQFVKAGLRRTTSIGFRPLEYSQLSDGGTRFSSWEWLESSLVTVPANADCTITGFKAARARPVLRASNTGNANRTVKLDAREIAFGKMMAEAQERAARRKRLGISSVVRLSPADRASGLVIPRRGVVKL